MRFVDVEAALWVHTYAGGELLEVEDELCP
jgi:hypothetical protein